MQFSHEYQGGGMLALKRKEPTMTYRMYTLTALIGIALAIVWVTSVSAQVACGKRDQITGTLLQNHA
jgi:hypothetical protein